MCSPIPLFGNHSGGFINKYIMKPRMVLNNLKGRQHYVTIPRSSTYFL